MDGEAGQGRTAGCYGESSAVDELLQATDRAMRIHAIRGRKVLGKEGEERRLASSGSIGIAIECLETFREE